MVSVVRADAAHAANAPAAVRATKRRRNKRKRNLGLKVGVATGCQRFAAV